MRSSASCALFLLLVALAPAGPGRANADARPWRIVIAPRASVAHAARDSLAVRIVRRGLSSVRPLGAASGALAPILIAEAPDSIAAARAVITLNGDPAVAWAEV